MYRARRIDVAAYAQAVVGVLECRASSMRNVIGSSIMLPAGNAFV
jgi:hypothetical protein